ncbi:MAG TPA: CHAD domain-containing protein [Alphaproteobacteria bacterium]|nr:CHAD domain-containing protein [Alphaproteobacteria bacterium]
METELKFSLPEDALQRIETIAPLASRFIGAATERHEITTYFDTPDCLLNKAGFSLRVRRAEGRFKQTLKAVCAHSATSRHEFEWATADNKVDLSKLAETPAGSLLSKIRGRLRPVFVTDVRRRTRDLRLENDGLAEMAIDLGEIKAGNAAEPVRELELEIKKGGVEPLCRLALELHAHAPLAMEFQSKADRGYRLRDGSISEPRKAPKIELFRDVTTHDALRTIIGAELAHLAGNETPAIRDGQVEGVHQMRVAIRKLRSALVLFSRQLEPVAAEAFQNELRRLGDIFGDARDWGVFLCEALHGAEEAGIAREWLALLEKPAHVELDRENQRLRDATRQPAFTGFMLGLTAWAEGQVWCPPGKNARKIARRPLRDSADDMLERLAAKVSKRGDKLDGSDERLHALRKSLKKLRYGIDYLAGLYGAKQVKRYRKVCKRLQNILGTINDAAATDRLAGSLESHDRPDLAVAVGALAQWNSGRREEARAGFDRAWKRFRKAEPFWG